MKSSEQESADEEPKESRGIPEAPVREYTLRLAQRRERAQRLARLDAQIANTRLLVFVVGLVVAWEAFEAQTLSGWWLVVPVLVFGVLVIVHARVFQRHRDATYSVAFYEAGLARLEDRWSGNGTPGTDFLDEHHPYAADLDLFGSGSVFERLCTARTKGGEATLARWLCEPTTPSTIRSRQSAVAELAPLLDLREELALMGAAVRSQLHNQALEAWAVAPQELGGRWLRLAALVLAAAAVIGLGVAGFTGDLRPLAAAIAVEQVLKLCVRRRVARVVQSIDQPKGELVLLAKMLALLERQPFRSARLVELRSALEDHSESASRQIEMLRRRVDLLDYGHNLFFAPIAVLLLWKTQFAISLETWRIRYGGAVRGWLEIVGEIEALISLAGYTYENPDDPFPEIADERTCFEARAMGHPLIPERRCVRNDIKLDFPHQALVVSGSNMSGKSTLLRTVGVNAVLAMAGAPVRALELRLSPLAVGASIRRRDSLREGTSTFYAEITRLRQIVDLSSGSLPLLFLLDEILHGTNSRDRRVGAEAIVRNLVEAGAIGLITTHDLALAQIADSLQPRVGNVHFADQIEDGRMTFDYQMHPGVIEHSNALALMRAIGLKV